MWQIEPGATCSATLGSKTCLWLAGNDRSQDVAVALHHAHDQRLVLVLAAALAVTAPEGELPANPCLVNLDNLPGTAKQNVSVNIGQRKRISPAMRHAVL